MDSEIVLPLTIALVLMVAFFMAGLHVAVALSLVSVILLFFFADRPLWSIYGQLPWNVSNSFVMVAIPLFILMGEILLVSGVAEQMYNSLSKWTSWLPGGLIHTNIGASGVFAALSGSSSATAATISTVALPSFRARQYDERLVLGSLAAAGTLGILIPPSINLIVYGVLMEQSIGQLFMAGVVPGILSILVYVALIIVVAIRWPSVAPREHSSWPERVHTLPSLAPVVALILIVLGSIYLGIATPTEAASFGVVGALLIGLGYRSLSIKKLNEAVLATAKLSGMIMLVVTSAFLLQFTFAILGISSGLAEIVDELGLTSFQVLLVIVAFYIVLGMFMETFAIVVTTVSIVLPILEAHDINLIWFIIIAVKATEMGQISPPYGLNLFVLQGVRTSGQPGHAGTIWDLYVGVLPFIVADFIMLGLILLVPQIATWLPGTLR